MDDARTLADLLQQQIELSEASASRQQTDFAARCQQAAELSARIEQGAKALAVERANLDDARIEVDALRVKALQEGEAQSRALVEEARTKVASMMRELSTMETERLVKAEEAAAAHVVLMKKYEQEVAELKRRHEAAERSAQLRLAEMESAHKASVAQREEDFDAACVDKQSRLAALQANESQAYQRLARIKGAGKSRKPFLIQIGGQVFTTTLATLTAIPDSLIARAIDEHLQEKDDEPLFLDGNPTYFELVLAYLRQPDILPELSDRGQLQCLCSEAKFYGLSALVALCKATTDAISVFKNLDSFVKHGNLYLTDEVDTKAKQEIVCQIIASNATCSKWSSGKLLLSHNKLGDEAGKEIAEALKTNKTLQTLELSHNKLGDEAGKEIAEALKTNKTLQTLVLGIGSSSFTAKFKDRTLTVSGSNSAVVTQLIPSILRCGAVELKFDGNKLHDEVREAISKGLEANSSLEKLVLGIGSSSFTAKFKDRTLTVSGSNSAVVTQLIPSILRCGAVELKFDGNKLYDEVREASEALALATNSTLTWLE